MMRRRDLPERVEALASRVIGAAMEVHSVLGPGLLEKLYEEAMVVELQRAEIPVLRQFEIGVPYKDVVLRGQRIDLVVDRTVVVEVKAVASVLDVHKAQTLSYLRAGRFPLGLLLNFHATSLRDGMVRLINSPAVEPAPPVDSGRVPIPSSRPSRPSRSA